jgi:ABC-type Fe3+ transport system permease subunit
MTHRAAQWLTSLPRWALLALAGFALFAPLAVFFAELIPRAGEIGDATAGSAAEVARLRGIFARTVGIAAGAAAAGLGMAVAVFVALMAMRPRARAWAMPWFFLPLCIPGHFLAIAWIQACGQAGWLTAIIGGPGGFGNVAPGGIAAGGMPGGGIAGAIPGGSALDPVMIVGEGPWAGLLPGILYSPVGCAAVLALRWFPLALAALLAGRRGVPAAPLEAVALCAGPMPVWRGLLTRWLRVWMALGLLAVFLMALLDYEIPAMLRQHVFTVEIMTAFNVYYDAARAAGLALPLVAVSLPAALGLGWLLGQVKWQTARRFNAPLPRLPWLHAAPPMAAAGAILAGAVGFPLGTLAGMTGGLGAFAEVWPTMTGQLAASLKFSAGTVAAVLAVGVALTLPVVARGRGRGGRVWRGGVLVLLMILFALPGSLVGIAHIEFWNRPGITAFNAIYDSGWVMLLGLVGWALPVGGLVLLARAGELPETLRDLERVHPTGALERLRRHELPFLAPSLAAVAAITFLLAMQEVQSAILLATPGQETLPIRAMTLLHYAPDAMVAAFCLTAIAAALAPPLALAGVAKLVLRGRSG